MKVLVTGAAGFIGGRLTRRLLTDGLDSREVEVVCIDAFTDSYDPAIKRRVVNELAAPPRCTMIDADLRGDGRQHLLDGVEVVLHQAGQPGVRASWDDGFALYPEHNVQATQRLLEACTRRPLRRFVFASSSSVYGDARELPTPEDTLPQPVSPYGVTKLAAEHLCSVYAQDKALPVVCLRLFTVYGGGQRPDMALQRMIKAARTGAAFQLFGGGEQRRDLIHVDDVVTAILATVDAEVERGETLNIASGTNSSVNELLDLVRGAVGSAVPVERRPEQPGDIQHTDGDTSRAAARLGWRCTIGLSEGIQEQVATDLASIDVDAAALGSPTRRSLSPRN